MQASADRELSVPTVWADPADPRYQLARSAVLTGDADKLEQAPDTGIDIHALYGHIGQFQDSRPDEQHHFGRTLLHIAASKGFVPLVHLLLQRGANVEAHDWKQFAEQTAPPIFTACRGGQIEAVRCLIEAGAQLNVDNGFAGCLDAAYARPQGKEIVKLLLDSGADVNHCPGNGQTVLDAAIVAEDAEFILFLIERNVSLDTTLYGAVVHRVSDSVLNLLLSHGASDTNAKALTTACTQRRNSLVQQLLDRFGLPRQDYLSHVTSAAILANNTVALNLLRERGATLASPSLIKAAGDPNDQTDMVQYLINAGVDVHGSIKPVPAQAESTTSADPDSTDQEELEDDFDYMSRDVPGSTALHAVTMYVYPSIVQALLRAGAGVNAVNVHGVTPLMLVCWFADPDRRAVLRNERGRRAEVMAMLLQAGADIEMRDGKGRTAPDILESHEELGQQTKDVLMEMLRV